ncbi:MAG: hypothetical protein E7672_01435 [Ruminococcaceae bacterium]|nr:hypothetical protein [Oscillospiraceae bacterium]
MLKRKNTFTLDGTWKFMLDRHDSGGENGFMLKNIDTSLWREAEIPCTYEKAAQECGAYRGTVWFRKNFTANFEENYLVWLEFLAVNFRADIWINEKSVGTHIGGYIPFKFEVSSYLNNGENLIVVRVNNRMIPGMLPNNHYWRGCGGIIRSVNLYSTPVCSIDTVKVVKNGDKVDLTATVINHSVSDANISLGHKISVTDDTLSVSSEIPADSAADIKLSVPADKYKLWTPEEPAMYSVTTTLESEYGMDEVSVTFGVRDLEAKDGKILLNGKEIILRGVNRHEDSHRTGLATDVETSEADFKKIKKMNANYVRFCHYPHSEEELDICDRLGLVVFSEIPCNATLHHTKEFNEAESIKALPQLYANAREAAEIMVKRDYNHPCIFFWSASNETNETNATVREINDALIEYFKEFDPSRFAVHVSQGCYWHYGINQNGDLFKHDDVICINAYVTAERRGKEFGEENYKQAKEFWDRFIPEFNEKYPGKPILVTEFGYPTTNTRDSVHGERAQCETLHCDITSMEGRVAGYSIWHYADHAWEIAEDSTVYFGSYVSPYGIFTRDRKPKKAVSLVTELFGQFKENDNK